MVPTGHSLIKSENIFDYCVLPFSLNLYNFDGDRYYNTYLVYLLIKQWHTKLMHSLVCYCLYRLHLAVHVLNAAILPLSIQDGTSTIVA